MRLFQTYLFSLILSVMSLSSSASANVNMNYGTTYSNEETGFSISLPSNWILVRSEKKPFNSMISKLKSHGDKYLISAYNTKNKSILYIYSRNLPHFSLKLEGKIMSAILTKVLKQKTRTAHKVDKKLLSIKTQSLNNNKSMLIVSMESKKPQIRTRTLGIVMNGTHALHILHISHESEKIAQHQFQHIINGITLSPLLASNSKASNASTINNKIKENSQSISIYNEEIAIVTIPKSFTLQPEDVSKSQVSQAIRFSGGKKFWNKEGVDWLKMIIYNSNYLAVEIDIMKPVQSHQTMSIHDFHLFYQKLMSMVYFQSTKIKIACIGGMRYSKFTSFISSPQKPQAIIFAIKYRGYFINFGFVSYKGQLNTKQLKTIKKMIDSIQYPSADPSNACNDS